MQHEIVIDGDRFSDFHGFIEEFNRAYLPHFGGPSWEGDVSEIDDLLEIARNALGKPLAIRWVNSQKSRSNLGHGAMAQFMAREIANIPEWAMGPESYKLIRSGYQKSLDEAAAGHGRTLFEWLVWQIHDESGELVNLALE
jgi:hypothetical protein